MQRLSIIGNLGKDPEMHYTPEGKAVCDFRVAVNDGRDREGNDRTQWYKVTAWEKNAENAAEYLRKGSKVYIEGKPGLSTWQGQDGSPHADLTLTVGIMEFLTPRPAESEYPQQQAPQQQGRPQSMGPGDPRWSQYPQPQAPAPYYPPQQQAGPPQDYPQQQAPQPYQPPQPYQQPAGGYQQPAQGRAPAASPAPNDQVNSLEDLPF